MEASPPDPRADLTRATGVRQRRVMFGLFLTIFGILLTVLIFPVSNPALSRDLAVGGAGLVILWLGGIFMGSGMGTLRRRRRNPPV